MSDDDRGSCRACGGTGKIDDGDVSWDCSLCDGTGEATEMPGKPEGGTDG